MLAEGPVLHVGNGEIVRHTSLLPMAPAKVYIGFGGQGWPMQAATDMQIKLIRGLEANLKERAAVAVRVLYVYDADAKHNEEAWAKWLPQG